MGLTLNGKAVAASHAVGAKCDAVAHPWEIVRFPMQIGTVRCLSSTAPQRIERS